MSRLTLILIIVIGFASLTLQTKKVNCRKYVYAPVCRGVAAKRALPQMDLEISPESNPNGQIVIDQRGPTQWKDGSEKNLPSIMFRRFGQTIDYDNDNFLK